MKTTLPGIVILFALGCGGSSGAHDDDLSAAGDLAQRVADGALPIGRDSATGDLALPAETWTWIDVPAAKCRDGSSTGFGINANPASTKLLIFMQGGGACFNAQTCMANASSYGESDFASSAETSLGILDRTDQLNDLRDYNMVYVPYCTGDIHAGDNPNATVTGVTGTQQFVGYSNMTKYLQRIVEQFPATDEVMLTGSSAGGFGAAANFIQAQQTFGSVPVQLVDDSGPFMGSPYIASCLETQWIDVWGLDKTVIAACGADCMTGSNVLLDYQAHLGKAYPKNRLGLIDSVGDIVIRDYFGYGANNCTANVPLSASDYEAGLDQIRTTMATYDFGAFLFSGDVHTSLLVGYDTRETGGVQLTDWVGAIAATAVTNVGP